MTDPGHSVDGELQMCTDVMIAYSTKIARQKCQ